MRTVPPTEKGKYRAIASGAIANGKPVIVNTDGTVSVSGTGISIGSDTQLSTYSSQIVGITYDTNEDRVVFAYSNGNISGLTRLGTVSGTSITASGDQDAFDSSRVSGAEDSVTIGMAFDSSNNRVIYTYTDNGDGNVAKYIIGTVNSSSNRVTNFGTATSYSGTDNAYYTEVIYDPDAQKVVLSYDDPIANESYAVVGTIDPSDNSLSLGTPTQFAGASAYGNKIAYDTNANKHVFVYRDGNNSNYGTAIVATVSGTSISFGSEVVFNSASVPWKDVVFDSVNNKIVISYVDNGDSGKGKAIVGTVSGTSISFGTAVAFESTADSTSLISSGFNPSTGKVAIAYRDPSAGGGDDGFLVEGTVSGTSISFTARHEFETSSFGDSRMVYDPDTEQMIIVYIGPTSTRPKYIVFKEGAVNNLTTENYIGIATGGSYADGQSVTVDVIGTVNDDQSSLTAGQQYFVQSDATLGETADSPSVLAGTAISATELIVKE